MSFHANPTDIAFPLPLYNKSSTITQGQSKKPNNNNQAAAGAGGQGRSLTLACIMSDLQSAKHPLPHVHPQGPTSENRARKNIAALCMHAQRTRSNEHVGIKYASDFPHL